MRFVLRNIVVSILFIASFCANSQAQNLELTYGEHENFDRFVFKFDEKPQYTVTSDEYITVLRLPKGTIITEKNLNQYLGQKFIEKETSDENIVFMIPSPKVKNFEVEGKIVIDVKPYKQVTQPLKTIKKEETTKEEIKNEPVREYKEPVKVDKNKSLAFVWEEETGLAAFMRNGYLWLVFDGHHNLDINEASKGLEKYISEIKNMNEDVSIIKIKIRDNADFTITKNNNDWYVNFFNTPQDKKTYNIETKINFYENQAYLQMNIAEGVNNVIMMGDDETGDILMIAPVKAPMLGFNSDYKYIDVKSIKTFQGVLFQAFTDDIEMGHTLDEVFVKAHNRSLNISPDLKKNVQ